MSQSVSSNFSPLFAFLIKRSNLLRSPVLLFVVLSSATRTGLIFLINEAAERGGVSFGWGTGLIAVALVMLITTHQARMSGVYLVQRLVRELRVDISQKLLRADVKFFQTRDIGRIYHNATTHVDMVSSSTLMLVEIAQAALLLVFVLLYMVWQMPLAVVVTVLALGLGVAAFALNEQPANRAVRATHAASEAFQTTLNDLMRGYKELRLRRARREDIDTEIQSHIRMVEEKSITAERHYSLSLIVANGALAGALIAMVVLLPWLAGADSVTVLQILTLVLFSFGPIEAVISTIPKLMRAGVSFGIYQDLVATLLANAEHPDPEDADRPAQFETLELRGVTVELTRNVSTMDSAARDTFTLGPIDLTLYPGQSVFITGGNGMGKSTLLSLLTGLRHPDKGQILVDGVPVTRERISDYRALYASVFSEFYMFRKLYGLNAAEQERLIRHVGEMGLAEGVSLRDGAFSDLALSTGQMRRLALSIALAELRPIIVLDEFAADQDPGRRRFFYDDLVPRLAAEGHAVIAVTHDEHCFDKADRLIRMEDGQIVSDSMHSPASALEIPRVVRGKGS